MGTVALAIRAELRRRWRSWLAIAVLVSIVGGFALAGVAAGRRTNDAFPRFLAAHGFDVGVFSSTPVPFAKLPDVASVTTLVGPDNGQPICRDCDQPINPTDFGAIYVRPTARLPYQLVSGHLPHQSDPHQVVASFTLQALGVHLGTVIRVPFYLPSQKAAAEGATGRPPKPRGPTVAFTVVGFEVSEEELRPGTRRRTTSTPPRRSIERWCRT